MATTGPRFEKFSGRARKVFSFAQEEAQRLEHNYIGTEHILLGLVRETEGVGAKVLSGLGVDLSKVRATVEFTIGRSEKLVQGEIGLTPRSKKVVELAVDQARQMNHTYIGSHHLLIGLLREGVGVAAGVLESLGVTLDKVLVETQRILEQQPLDSEPDTVVAAEPDLASLVRQLVALHQDVEKIEAQIAEIEAIKLDLPAFEDELTMKRQEIREIIGELRALLPENEPQ